MISRKTVIACNSSTKVWNSAINIDSDSARNANTSRNLDSIHAGVAPISTIIINSGCDNISNNDDTVSAIIIATVVFGIFDDTNTSRTGHTACDSSITVNANTVCITGTTIITAGNDAASGDRDTSRTISATFSSTIVHNNVDTISTSNDTTTS